VSIVNEGSGASNGDPRAAGRIRRSERLEHAWRWSLQCPIPRGMGSEYYNMSRRLWSRFTSSLTAVSISVWSIESGTDPALDSLAFSWPRDCRTCGTGCRCLQSSFSPKPVKNPTVFGPDLRSSVMIYRVPSDAINDILVSQSSADYRDRLQHKTRCSSLTAQSSIATSIQLTRPRFIVWLWLLQWLVLPNSILGHLVSKISPRHSEQACQAQVDVTFASSDTRRCSWQCLS